LNQYFVRFEHAKDGRNRQRKKRRKEGRDEPVERELARRRDGFSRADGGLSGRDGSVEIGDGSVRRASSSFELEAKSQQTLAFAKLKKDKENEDMGEIKVSSRSEGATETYLDSNIGRWHGRRDVAPDLKKKGGRREESRERRGSKRRKGERTRLTSTSADPRILSFPRVWCSMTETEAVLSLGLREN